MMYPQSSLVTILKELAYTQQTTKKIKKEYLANANKTNSSYKTYSN